PAPVAPTPVAPTPVAPTPVAPTPVAPTPAAPAATPTAAPIAGAANHEIKPMSQFVWYGWGQRELHVAEVGAAAKVIRDAFGMCTAEDVVTPAKDAPILTQDLNPNDGYWWFRADGTPTWSGRCGGTQYVRATVTWSYAMNNVSHYLAEHAPGA